MQEPENLRGVVNLAFDRHSARSGAALARIAQAAGFDIVSTTINNIRAGTYPYRPNAATIRALAFLSGLPLNTVAKVAGVEMSGTPFAERLPRDVDLLSEQDKDALLRLLRSMIDTQRKLREAHDPPDADDPRSG